MALFRTITTTDDLPDIGAGRESGTFDFKGAANPADKRELAKDVAAFANALGGVVLVGAVEHEELGTLQKYSPMTAAFAESLKAAYETAVAEFCRPQPVLEVLRIQARSSPRYVVAANVHAIPLGPVGVRWNDDMKKTAWVFPLRTTTHTTFLTPTEIAMLMVPEIRRVAILLDSIPLDQRTGVILIANSRAGHADPRIVTFAGIDRNLTTLLATRSCLARLPRADGAGDALRHLRTRDLESPARQGMWRAPEARAVDPCRDRSARRSDS